MLRRDIYVALDSLFCFFFNDTATTEIYTLSLHDALPISRNHPPPDPRRRRQAVLPAALLTRPQPDRAGLRQAQDPAAQSRRANERGHLETDRRPARPLHTAGMRQLPRQRWLCFGLKGSRSRFRL